MVVEALFPNGYISEIEVVMRLLCRKMSSFHILKSAFSFLDDDLLAESVNLLDYSDA
jgi:hypothetical protein